MYRPLHPRHQHASSRTRERLGSSTHPPHMRTDMRACVGCMCRRAPRVRPAVPTRLPCCLFVCIKGSLFIPHSLLASSLLSLVAWAHGRPGLFHPRQPNFQRHPYPPHHAAAPRSSPHGAKGAFGMALMLTRRPLALATMQGHILHVTR